MTYIVVGRVLKNNRLVGIKIINLYDFSYSWIRKDLFYYFFSRNNILNCKYNSDRLLSTITWLKIMELATFSDKGTLIKDGLYSDSKLVSLICNQDESYIGMRICGAICGAITDEFSLDAERHAILYYQEVRKMSTDIDKIAKNTNWDKADIAAIKNYVFMEYHSLQTGYKQFDPCFSMALS